MELLLTLELCHSKKKREKKKDLIFKKESGVRKRRINILCVRRSVWS